MLNEQDSPVDNGATAGAHNIACPQSGANFTSSGAKNQELDEFGALADRLGRHAIEQGGYIVAGPEYLPPQTPWKEKQLDEPAEPGSQEAGSPAGARKRPSSEAAPGEPVHPVEHFLNGVMKIDELNEYHPNARVLGVSSTCMYMVVPVGLFRSLPHRAHLLVEIPILDPSRTPWSRDRIDHGVAVPDVRAWAYWSDGILIRSHHTNPDLSICACMPGDWLRGRDPLHAYVELCMVWIAKVLHTQHLGRWPGLQHYSPTICIQRNAVDEYCPCGAAQTWATCCMAKDLASPVYDRIIGEMKVESRYLHKVRRQGRPMGPPVSWAPTHFTARSP